MCGIAGFIMHGDAAGGPHGAQAAVTAMADAIAHRGPDDSSTFVTRTADGRRVVALGHRRLSIIDLDTGQQPMTNEDGTIHIIFNGEIYNFKALRDELITRGHRFKTASDTETIVHAYEEFGEACVQRLRGMFAFAIWDAKRQRLFLARDRFGKKPLFVFASDDQLAFGSEIKALLTLSVVTARVDMDAVWDYLAYRYVPGPRTMFKGITKLAPGCWRIWENGRLGPDNRYYTPPDRAPYDRSAVDPSPIAKMSALIEDSVQARMVSDVPFGAFLSGGIDSSAVVALMSRHSSLPIKTYSVGFSEAAYSELAYARMAAELFKTDHHELVVSSDHLMDDLPRMIWHRDAPVAEPSDIPIFLLSKEARRTVKMVLTGEGGDEFFGGYPKHVYERFTPWYQLIPGGLRRHLVEPLVQALPYRFRRAKTAATNLGLDDWTARMPRWFGALTPHARAHLTAFAPPVESAEQPWHLSPPCTSSPLRKILYFDQTSWLPDNLLERGDRVTMAASLEARMPFVDHEIAGYLSTLPDHFRVRGMQTKWLFRQTMKQILPAAILERPKVGFRVPVNEWFRGTMRDYLYDHLTGAESKTRAFYDSDALNNILRAHVDGRQNHEKLLWSLLTLELWHRQYLVG